jgi:hypothetical protein
MTASVERDQTEGTKRGVPSTDSHQQKDPAIRTQIDFSERISEKVEE